MPLQDVLSKISDETIRAEILAEHAAEIEAEKAKGIEASGKKSVEVKKHMTRANSLADVLRNSFEIDPDGDIVAQIEEKKKTVGGNADPEWKKEQAAMKRQLKEVTDKLTAKEKRELELVKANVLTKAISSLQGKLKSHEAHAKTLFYEGKIGIGSDGQTIVGKNGDDEIDFEEYLNSYIKANPDSAIVDQRGGGGSHSSKPNKDQKTMARAEWDGLPAKQKAEYLAGGGTLI